MTMAGEINVRYRHDGTDETAVSIDNGDIASPDNGKDQRDLEHATLLFKDRAKKFGFPQMRDGVDYINAGEEEQMECFGYCRHSLFSALTWIVIVCTAGLVRLVFHWKPHWMLRCTHVRCPLHAATSVLLVDQYNQMFVERIKTATSAGVDVTSMVSLTVSSGGEEWGAAGESSPQRKNPNDPPNLHLDHLIKIDPGGVSRSVDRIVYFENKKVKYLWDSEESRFVRLCGLDRYVPCSFFHRQDGLTLQEQLARRVLYGDNSIMVEIQSIFLILIKEVLEPFYVFQIASMIIWYCDDYMYYATCIIVMSTLSLATGVYQIRTNQRSLRDTVHDTDVVTVIRGGSNLQETIPSEHLVPGDVIIIPRRGCVMHCDAVLVAGNCIVNESMLTGESVPVTKTALPQYANENYPAYNSKEHSRHTLFCGTKVIQTRFYGDEPVRAVVVRTGFMTSKGELVRSIMFPKPVDFKFNRHISKFLLCMAVFASIGLIYTVVIKSMRHVPVSHILLRALDVITIIIPPALPAAMTIGIVFAQGRLRRHAQLYCISPRSINISGCINCFCFDKTGTLTEDGLDLWGVVPIDEKHRILDPIHDVCEHVPSESLLRVAMATCHSLTIIENQLSGDPLDLKMFEASGWSLEEPDIDDTQKFDVMAPTVVRPPHTLSSKSNELNTSEVGIVRELPFSSSLQRMSVITRQLGSDHFRVFTKGAPETVASHCLPDSVPDNFTAVLAKYTEKGYRVLAIATRTLRVSLPKVHRLSRDDVESDLELVGLLIMENRLKPITTSVISLLKTANIRPIMVTGDNSLTALSVARECGMIEHGDEVILLQAAVIDGEAKIAWHYAPSVADGVSSTVSMECVTVNSNNSFTDMSISMPMKCARVHVVLTGKTFAVLRTHFPEVLRRIAVAGTVFARMAPEQKQQLIELLQELEYYVGMCGDGANDCGALKAAHAGISLSDTEASVASPFTSKIADISCVPSLIKEGRCALVTSFGVLKYMALYSMTQFSSVLVLYTLHTNLTDMEFLYIDLCLITVLAALYGRTEPHPNLSKTPPPLSLIGLTPLTSIFSQILLVICAQIAAVSLLWRQPWYVEHLSVDDSQDDLASHDNYTVFAVSVFQYISLAVIFSKGKPYRKPIYTNRWLICALLVMTIASGYLVTAPAHVIADFFELDITEVPGSFRAICVSIALIHFIVAYFIENVLVQTLLHRFANKRRQRTHPPYYMEIQQEIDAAPSGAWLPASSQSASGLSDVTSQSSLATPNGCANGGAVMIDAHRVKVTKM